MKLPTKAVGLALTAIVLYGVGVGTASAATAGGVRATAGDTTTTTVVAYQGALNTLQSVSLPRFTCPMEEPWLINLTLSAPRIVPAGVVVDEPGGIGVTIPHPTAGPRGLANGWTSGTATNWGTYNILTVSAVCTSSPAAAYPA